MKKIPINTEIDLGIILAMAIIVLTGIFAVSSWIQVNQFEKRITRVEQIQGFIVNTLQKKDIIQPQKKAAPTAPKKEPKPKPKGKPAPEPKG